MDGLKLIRKQDKQDNDIAVVTKEVVDARESVKHKYPTLKARLDDMDMNASNSYVLKTGDTMTGNLNFDNVNLGLSHAGRVCIRGVNNSTVLSSNTGGQIYFRPNGNNNTNNQVAINNNGQVTAPLFNGNLNGNSTSATKLQTPKKINGADFDGTKEIVTEKWGKTRNITIGNLQKQVDGSQDINFSLQDIGVAETNHNHDNDYLKLSGGQITGDLIVTGNITGDLIGNSDTATTLQTAREIKVGNSIKNFDGSNNIEFTLQDIGAAASNHLHDNRYLQLTGGTVTGAINANGGVIGDLTGNADTASGLKNPVNINNVPFDGTQNINVLDNTKLPLTGGTITGQLTVNNGITGNLTGNSTTATRLQTARKINGVDFDGTRDINVGVNTSTTTLGGYVKPNQGGAITPNDTLNQAFGKVEVNLDNKANINHNHTSNNITALTGYNKGNVTSALSPNDSLNTALSKLEVGIEGKANNNHTHNYAGSNTAGGVATSAHKLETARTIQLTGDITGQAAFDGTNNININTTIAAAAKARLRSLRSRTVVNNNTSTVNINIATYNANNDILNVYLAGVRLEPVQEYTATATTITLTGNNQFVNGDIVTIEVIQVI